MVRVCLLTQGAALGYVVLPLRGVPLASFGTSSSYTLLCITKINKKRLNADADTRSVEKKE